MRSRVLSILATLALLLTLPGMPRAAAQDSLPTTELVTAPGEPLAGVHRVLGQPDATRPAYLKALSPAADEPLLPPPFEKAPPASVTAVGWNTLLSTGFEPSGGYPWRPTGLWRAFDAYPQDNDQYWGAQRRNPKTGTYSLWPAAAGVDGLGSQNVNYPNDLDSWLIYGPVSLATYTAAELSFDAIYWTEYGYDFFEYLVSPDGHDFYGYNLHGQSNTYYRYTFNLADVPSLPDRSVLGEEQVWIAFHFFSDFRDNDLGPFIDNVTLRAYEPAAPDLRPQALANWGTPIGLDNLTNTHFLDSPFTGEPVYIDWAVANLGKSAGPSVACLDVDSVEVQCWDVPALATTQSAKVEDWLLPFVPDYGPHTLNLRVDVHNAVAESDEGNNAWAASPFWYDSPTFSCLNGFTAVETLADWAGPVEPPAPLEPYQVRLLSQTFTPPAQPPAALDAALADTLADGGDGLALVQFTGLPSRAEQAAWARRGVSLLQYIPDRAWIARLSGSGLAALRADPGVRWAGPYSPDLRRSPMLDSASVSAALDASASDSLAVLVEFAPDRALAEGVAALEALGGQVLSQVETIHAAVAVLPAATWRAVTALSEVVWVEPPPLGFDPLNDCVRWRLGGNTLQSAPYNLTGQGVDLLVYDGGSVASSTFNFEGRILRPDGAPTSNHATHVAGTAAGAGAQAPDGRRLQGLAPAARVLSYGFDSLTWAPGWLYTDPGDIERDWREAKLTYGADLGTASIGTNVAGNGFNCAWEGDYGAVSQLIDGIVAGSLGEPVIATWAAGNERGGSARCGSGYRTTAPPSNAKNPIHVGATNSDNDLITGFSSFGPSDDGRIKPTLSAPGCEALSGASVYSSVPYYGYTGMCGTSMATPAVAGVVALMLERYHAIAGADSEPLPSTIKALLIHTAADRGNPGPDYQYGYGRVDGVAAVNLLTAGTYLQFAASAGTSGFYFPITVAPGTAELKVTLAWDDAPASPAAATQLVNDLDLRLISPSGYTSLPWVLNPAVPAANATTGEDHLNNQEQVRVLNPAPGQWVAWVGATAVPTGSQRYSLVWSGGTLEDTFLKTYLPALLR
jgi:subtilisin family serine protease